MGGVPACPAGPFSWSRHTRPASSLPRCCGRQTCLAAPWRAVHRHPPACVHAQARALFSDDLSPDNVDMQLFVRSPVTPGLPIALVPVADAAGARFMTRAPDDADDQGGAPAADGGAVLPAPPASG